MPLLPPRIGVERADPAVAPWAMAEEETAAVRLHATSHHCTRSMQRLGIVPSVMLVGIGCAISLVIAVVMMRSAKARSKQNRNRILRDYVRRTY